MAKKQIIRKDDMSLFTAWSGQIEDKHFTPAATVVTDNEVEPYLGEALTKALVDLDKDTDDNSQLYAFWSAKVRPYVVQAVRLSFYINSGMNFNSQGMVQPQGENITPITPEQRKVLIAQAKRDKAVYLTRMINARNIRSVASNNRAFEFDGTQYSLDKNVKDKKPPVAGVTKGKTSKRGRKKGE